MPHAKFQSPSIDIDRDFQLSFRVRKKGREKERKERERKDRTLKKTKMGNGEKRCPNYC